jgi:hypothetical protein
VTDGNDAAAIRFMLMAMAPDRAPRAPGNKPAARLPVVLQGASVDSASRQRVAPGKWAEGRPRPALPICPVCERGFGGPDARTRQIRILNRQHGLLTVLNQPWQAGVVPCGDTGSVHGHTAAPIVR